MRASWAAPGTLVLASASDRWTSTFTVDGAELTEDADALLCAGLLPAMATGEGLELDLPVSAELLRNAEHLVEVFAGWWPDELTRVPVVAPVAKPRRRRSRAETVMAFSGGVRSLVASLEAPSGHVALIVEGMGEVAPTPPTWPVPEVTLHTDLAAVLTATGVPASAVSPTAVLAVVGHALDGVGRLEVSSAFGWLDQFAHGSHVLTDPLWSGAATTFAVTGAHRDRVACIETLVAVADEVRPVGADGVLTRATLRALGVAGRWPEIAPVDLEAVAALPVVGPADLARVAEIRLRLEDGRDPELLAALDAAVRTTTAAGVSWPAGWTRVLPDLGSARAS